MSVKDKEKISQKISLLQKNLEGKKLTEEQVKMAKVYLGKKNVVELKTADIETLKDSLFLTKGNKEKGAKHIIFKHFDEQKTSLTADELVDIVEIIRKSNVESITPTRRKYTHIDKDGIRFRVIIDEDTKKKN